MRRDRLLTSYIREMYVVTLKDGQTFRGLLDSYDDGHLLLVEAEHLAGETQVKLDGQLLIPRSNVAFLQRP